MCRARRENGFIDEGLENERGNHVRVEGVGAMI